MTRRNDKRNNRRNRQRNNTPELPPFAQMLFGALLGKGVDMIAKKMAEIAEEETPDIHAEGISNQDVTNINNGKATLSKLRIPADGSAVEYPIPDNLQFFFAEDGKLMVRQKIEGDENPTDAGEGKPITYDDVYKELFLNKKEYFVRHRIIMSETADKFSYKDIDNCTSEAQAKRLIAFNKLMNIAKYLNGDWKPDFWDIEEDKFYISFNGGDVILKDDENEYYNFSVHNNDHDPCYSSMVYFKTEKLAHEAIHLMGKESLRDLFSTDW